MLMAGCQRQMIYFPSNASEKRLQREAEKKDLGAWRNPAGELIGWKAAGSRASSERRAVVFFHGNAGYALHRDYFADGFLALTEPWSVYIFEYPGYGARPGSPSEKVFVSASSAAVEELFATHEQLYLAGESIGTGVVCHLAKRFASRIDGLLLITPFTSLAAVGKKHYPFLPVGLLLRDRYDNLEALKGYKGPAAFIIAGEDEIIPPFLGRELYEAYIGPKRMWVQEGRGHNTLDYNPGAPWWSEVTDFLIDAGGEG